jgi:hypothetical protein
MDPYKEENENRHGDKGHTTEGRYCGTYKIPPTKMV